MSDRRPTENLSSASDHHSIEHQQDHRADDGENPTGGVVLAAEGHAANPSADETAGNTEQDGNDAPAGIASGHEEFGYDPDDQADDNCGDDCAHNFDSGSTGLFAEPLEIGRRKYLQFDDLGGLNILAGVNLSEQRIARRSVEIQHGQSRSTGLIPTKRHGRDIDTVIA